MNDDAADLPDLFSAGDRPVIEDLDDGTGWMLDLVAAVEFLRRGDRHGFTVWNAIEEALCWWTAERLAVQDGVSTDRPSSWSDADPLCTALREFVQIVDRTNLIGAEAGLQQAVRRWVTTMATLYNDDCAWPHPLPRRRFPPPPAGEDRSQPHDA